MKPFFMLFVILAATISINATAACGDPVISPSPIPPDCQGVYVDGMWQKRADQQTLVCRYSDGLLLRFNQMSMQIEQNNLTQEERCELMRCVFNDADWCNR